MYLPLLLRMLSLQEDRNLPMEAEEELQPSDLNLKTVE
jgi:hypothetical protein